MTKTERRDRARSLIDQRRVGVPFTCSELSSLLGDDAATVYVRRVNPSFPNDPRHLHRLESGSFSWARALDDEWRRATGRAPRNHQPELVYRALRAAVSMDLADYLSADDGPCVRCGSDEDRTADHAAPPFLVIARGFLARHGAPALVNRDDGAGYVLEDAATEAAWIAWQSGHATLQVLCRSCNASKGAR